MHLFLIRFNMIRNRKKLSNSVSNGINAGINVKIEKNNLQIYTILICNLKMN